MTLIPRASILNSLAYRSNPKETKELRRQVSEFMKNRYVHESMSPYVVPVLLVPKNDGLGRMCVDCCAINNTTAEYRYHILRLNDMLDSYMVHVLFFVAQN